MKFKIKSEIEISFEEKKYKKNYIEILKKILKDEDKKIGKRAEFDFEKKENKIIIKIKAKDAIALKTAISAITTILQLVENALNIE